MKKYKVKITETLGKIVEQEAESYEDAEDLVREKYNNDEIELDYSDLEEVWYDSYPSVKLKDSFKLSIDFDKKNKKMYISLEGLSGISYDCKTFADMQWNIDRFMGDFIEVEQEKGKDNKEMER